MSYTVKFLIERLQECNPNHLVVLQRDPEGNGYSPIQGVDSDDVLFRECDGGMVLSTQDLADEIEGGYVDDESEFEPCVVLFPVY